MFTWKHFIKTKLNCFFFLFCFISSRYCFVRQVSKSPSTRSDKRPWQWERWPNRKVRQQEDTRWLPLSSLTGLLCLLIAVYSLINLLFCFVSPTFEVSTQFFVFFCTCLILEHLDFHWSRKVNRINVVSVEAELLTVKHCGFRLRVCRSFIWMTWWFMCVVRLLLSINEKTEGCLHELLTYFKGDTEWSSHGGLCVLLAVKWIIVSEDFADFSVPERDWLLVLVNNIWQQK